MRVPYYSFPFSPYKRFCAQMYSIYSVFHLYYSIFFIYKNQLQIWLTAVLYCSVTVVDFFNRINLIYGTVSDYCTEESCPTMSGGPRFEYLWADGVKYKKPTPLPAPRYVNLLMDWVESQINNETLFPVMTGKILLVERWVTVYCGTIMY